MVDFADIIFQILGKSAVLFDWQCTILNGIKWHRTVDVVNGALFSKLYRNRTNEKWVRQ